MDCQPEQVHLAVPEPVDCSCLPANADQLSTESSELQSHTSLRGDLEKVDSADAKQPSAIQLDAWSSVDVCADPENVTGLPSNRVIPEDEPGIHRVTFCVTISVGFSTGGCLYSSCNSNSDLISTTWLQPPKIS